MTDSPKLISLTIANPKHRLGQEDVVSVARNVFSNDLPYLESLLPIYRNAGINTRYCCEPPDWFLKDHSFEEKNDLYIAHALDLLEEVALSSARAARIGIGEVDQIVLVSSTGISTPSLEARLMNRMDFKRTIQRTPVFGLGCAGGVLGLSRSAQLSKADPGKNILLLVVELCTLTFCIQHKTKQNVVATALFGDGAAGIIINTHGKGPVLEFSGEYAWKNTEDIMGWDVSDKGLGVVFSKKIPSLVERDMYQKTLGFLNQHGLKLEDIDEILAHPGGAKVLSALEKIFGLDEGGMKLSRKVLLDYGNMSAATVLFVLQKALEREESKRYLLMTLGPGFSAGFLTIKS